LGEPDLHSTSGVALPAMGLRIPAVSRCAATPLHTCRQSHTFAGRPTLATSPIATESTRIARAGVYRSARLWARWNRAALAPRVVPLKLGYPARRRVVWSSGRERLRVGSQGHCWPSGRSGAGWGRSQGLPWVGGGLGGALRRQRRRSSRGRLFRAYPPWAASPRSSAWRGGGVKIGKVYGTVFFRLRIV